jgi:hypothetical protein
MARRRDADDHDEARANVGGSRASTSTVDSNVAGESHEAVHGEWRLSAAEGPNYCFYPLPPQPVTNIFEFGQFILLADNRTKRAKTLPLWQVESQGETLQRGVTDQSRLAESKPLFPRAWVRPNYVSAPDRAIRVSATDLLANKKVRLARKNVRLNLSKREAFDIASGRPVVVEVRVNRQKQRVLLQPDGSESSRLAGVIPIHDLASVSASSAVEVGGNTLVLPRKTVNELEANGFALLDIGASGDRSKRALLAVADPMTTTATRTAGEPRAFAAPGLVPMTVDPWNVLPEGFPMALYMPYRQEWRLASYGLGERLNSIPLTAEESTTIELFSWDRRAIASEYTQTIDQQSSFESSLNLSTTTQIVRDAASENSWKLDTSGKIQVPFVTISADAALSNKLSTHTTDTRSSLTQASTKATMSMKATRQSKVSETREFGSELRVTRTIKNTNMVRRLTYHYFEIVANYDVSTALERDRILLCVLVPNFAFGSINRNFILVNEGVLKRTLLDSSYSGGFDAARLLAEFDASCDVRRMDECEPHPVAPQTDASTTALKRIMGAADTLKKAIDAIQQATRGPLPWNTDLNSPSWEQAVQNFHVALYVAVGLVERADAFLTACELFARVHEYAPPNAPDTRDGELTRRRLITLLRDTDRSRWLRRAQLPQEAPSRLGWVVSQMQYASPMRLLDYVGFDDAGLEGAVDEASAALDAYDALVAPPAPTTTPTSATGPAGAAAPADDKVRGYDVPTLAAAVVEENRLIQHLTANSAHYRQAIWAALDPDDRFVWLSLLASGLFDYVENRIVGFVGPYAALPFRTAEFPFASEWLNNVIAKIESQSSTARVVAPTPGIEVVPSLGDCDTGEPFVIGHQRLDLELQAAHVQAASETAMQASLETQRRERLMGEGDLRDPAPPPAVPAIRIILQPDPETTGDTEEKLPA